jgi:Mce-associated membrane protein
MPRFVPRALRGQTQRGQTQRPKAQRDRGTEAPRRVTGTPAEPATSEAEQAAGRPAWGEIIEVAPPAADDTRTDTSTDDTRTDTSTDGDTAAGSGRRRPSPRPRPGSRPSPRPVSATRTEATDTEVTDTDDTDTDDTDIGASDIGARDIGAADTGAADEEAAGGRRPPVKAPARPTGGKGGGKAAGKGGQRRPGGRGGSAERRESGRKAKLRARRAAVRLGRLHRAVVVLAVLVVLSGLAVLFTAGGWLGTGVSSHIADGARNDALASANAAAPALLSYDYRSFDTSVAKGRKYVTGPFAKQYASTTKGLKANAVKEHAVVSAQVSASGVVSATPKQVVVLLYVNQYRQNSNITGQKVDQNRVVMTMTLVGQTWKVSKVTAI